MKVLFSTGKRRLSHGPSRVTVVTVVNFDIN